MSPIGRQPLPSRQGQPSPARATRPVRFTLHGHAVSLLIEAPGLARVANAHLERLITPDAPPTIPTIDGAVLQYRETDVLRHVSRDAVAVVEGDPHYHPLLEMFRSRDGGRWWLVDERWGLCEIDLVGRQWRSFVLPEPSVDPVNLFEAAVWWPVAQLLRGVGLPLIPAASFGHNGRGVLILSRASLGPELLALPQHGIGIVGQRWTALREEPDGRVSLLAVPGLTSTRQPNRPLSIASDSLDDWFNASTLLAANQVRCDLILIAEPMRRARAAAFPLTTAEALRQVKLAWPIPPVGSAGVLNPLPARLARGRSVHRVQLGRDGNDLARLLLGSRPTTTVAVVAA